MRIILALAPLAGMHPQQVAAENLHQAPLSQMSSSFLGKSITQPYMLLLLC